MAGKRVHGAQILRAARLVIVAAVFAVPRLCLAQDDRSDDPPDLPKATLTNGSSTAGGQAGTGGAIGTSGVNATSPTPIRGLFTEPKVFRDAINYSLDKFDTDNQRNKNGWYLELSNMITGSGWISAGPGYRRYLWNDNAYYDASAAASWHLYTMAQTRFEVPDYGKHHIQAGAQVMWQDQTQINYFGIGPDAPENQSQYRLRSTDVVGYASFKPANAWTIGGEVGYLASPQLSSPAGTFKPNVPTTQELFPFDPGTQVSDQPSFVHGEVAVTADTRNYRSYPTDGGLYRVAAETYQDTHTGLFTFQQYQAEALQLVRVTGPNWVLGFHAWLVTSDLQSGHEVPFYFQPSLGGATSLRSYESYRFHDLDSLLLNAESRWAVYRNVDLALFVDAGNVAPVFDQLNVGHTSVGTGVRFHSDHTNFARLDVAHGSEGWQVVFRTGDFFRFARITRRVADIPFVP